MRSNFLNLVAKTPQNTGGGCSRTKRATLALPLRYFCAMLLALVLGISNVLADDYVLSIGTTTAWNGDASDGKSTTFVSGGQTFTIAKGSTAGTAGKMGTDLLKLSKNATYTITLPDGFTANSINFKGYANNASTGAIDKVNGATVSYEFPGNAVASTEASWGNFTSTITGTTGTITFHITSSQQIGVIITITGTPAATGPVDPVFTYTPATYTIGDPALDLSTKVTSTNTTGAITFAVSTADAGTTGASIANGKNFTATAAGTAKITVSQAASTGYNAKSQDIEVTVVAPAPAACPAGLAISGTAAYTEGQTISLTAALDEGNGEITYTWYKGADLAAAKTAGSIGTGASFSKASCATSDEGNYYCVASKDDCSDAESAAYAVTVEALVACYAYVAPLDQTTTFHEGNVISSLAGGEITVYSEAKNSDSSSKNGINYTNAGLALTKGADDRIKVTLNHLMQVGTVITINMTSGTGSSNPRGLYLKNELNANVKDLENQNVLFGWATTPAESETQTYTYTVRAGDGLAGKNIFILQRQNTVYIRSISVSNCGAELVYYGLTYAVVPSGKGTVTLSAASLLEGETATATYAISDENYEFDEWQISGTGAALSGAEGDHVTVTMGSADAVVTLKLKEKAGFAVTYKANNGTEEADVVVSKENTFAANTFTVPDGKMFAGWNTKADGEGTNYAVGDAVEAATTVYAKWVVDPTIRLIKKVGEEYVLNTTDFQTAIDLVDGVAGSGYEKQGKVKNNISGISNFDNLGKGVIYHTSTNATKVTIAMYNNYTSNNTSTAYYVVVPEGTTSAPTATSMVVNKSEGKEFEVNMTGRSTLYVFSNQKELRISQISVLENGTANVVAPAVGYSVNLNKGRFYVPADEYEFEGITYRATSAVKPLNTIPQYKNAGADFVSFTIPEGQTRQLQLNATKAPYKISKVKGDVEDAYSPSAAETKNWNLTAGTWYINPNGSNLGINTITFAAAPDALTVTFKDGATTLGTQNVWSGEKAIALSPAPTKDGYRFVEWQLSGSAYDFDDEVTADITLDAVWQQVVTVTFAPANGEENFTKTADKGATLAAGDRPADPEYAGHVFQGWTRDASAEPVVYVDLATETFDANATLTAVWEVAQTDATISALSYNGNAIDVESAKDVAGVATYTVHLQWGTAIDKDLISVTKTASSATVGTIAYDSDAEKATFTVTAGDGTTTADYAIQFVIDAKRGTSLIKATTNNVVTGLIGGTIDQSYSGNANSRKLNKGNYFGVTLANDETFQEGDVFIVNITAPADLGKFMIYADAERTELVADQGIVYTKPDVENPVICPTGEMMMTLPAAANGKKSLYLSRENAENTQQWNVTFSYIEVTREMAPAIKSFMFGENAATINENATPKKTITIEVPYATDVTALTPTVEAYGNNGATYTPDGATDFTSPVNYVVTDAYGELSTTYAVTVNVAAPSENANLASLAVEGYSLDFDPATTSYNVVLDYGTTELPAITYAVEDAGLANAEKVEGGVNGATTITVTPQAGAGYEKVYTINFTVSTTPKFVIYDGSTMTNIPAATGSDVTTGFSWSMASGIGLTGDNVIGTWQGKNYAHAIKGFKPNDNTSNIVSFVIPENYLAKVRLVGSTNSDTKERSMFIAKAASRDVADAFENYVVTSSTYVAQGIITNLMLPGTYYLGSTDACRLFELSVQLYPINYSRDVTEGRFGTICLPNGGVMVGAELYEVAYKDPSLHKIFFDQIVSGEMIAGRPYIFLPKEGTSQLAVFYTDASNADAGNYHGLYGSYTEEQIEDGVGNYILLNNQYREVQTGGVAYVTPNRAYFKYSEIPGSAMAPMPGRKRMSIGAAAPAVTTGIDELNASETPVKVMIDGQLFIIRGEKMYNANGQLVK